MRESDSCVQASSHPHGLPAPHKPRAKQRLTADGSPRRVLRLLLWRRNCLSCFQPILGTRFEGARVEALFDEYSNEPIGPLRVWLKDMMLPGTSSTFYISSRPRVY
jgi:hypothetical protein